MKKYPLLFLYFIFLKIGAILLGGGYVILPIIINEFSKKRKFLREEQILEYFTLSQSLPGIIAANISMFIGYKMRGKIGAFVSMLGIITIPFISIVLLSAILSLLLENSIVKGIFWGVGISVIALIMLTVREIWMKSKRDLFFYFIFLFALILLLIFHLSPIHTILLSLFVGLISHKIFCKGEKI